MIKGTSELTSIAPLRRIYKVPQFTGNCVLRLLTACRNQKQLNSERSHQILPKTGSDKRQETSPCTVTIYNILRLTQDVNDNGVVACISARGFAVARLMPN